MRLSTFPKPCGQTLGFGMTSVKSYYHANGFCGAVMQVPNGICAIKARNWPQDVVQVNLGPPELDATAEKIEP
jgi:hypothetical protein